MLGMRQPPRSVQIRWCRPMPSRSASKLIRPPCQFTGSSTLGTSRVGGAMSVAVAVRSRPMDAGSWSSGVALPSARRVEAKNRLGWVLATSLSTWSLSGRNMSASLKVMSKATARGLKRASPSRSSPWMARGQGQAPASSLSTSRLFWSIATSTMSAGGDRVCECCSTRRSCRAWSARSSPPASQSRAAAAASASRGRRSGARLVELMHPRGGQGRGQRVRRESSRLPARSGFR